MIILGHESASFRILSMEEYFENILKKHSLFDGLFLAIFLWISYFIFTYHFTFLNQLTQNDRIGYHYSVMCVSAWPLLLLSAREASATRRHVERDIAVGLYSRTMFILFDVSIRQVFFNHTSSTVDKSWPTEGWLSKLLRIVHSKKK